MRARITALGDAALIVELAELIGEVPPQRIHAVCSWLTAAALPGVTELVPAATTITLFYSPVALIGEGAPADDLTGWLAVWITERLEKLPADGELPEARLVEIPVCYGGDCGPDLETVAARVGLSPQEIITRHAAADHRVLQLGFAPGFPYLSGLPTELTLPRLDTPRTSVPAGSVGIANGQTCIYPVAIPGGWNLIGRTPLKLFRPDHEPPVLLQPGDRVSFRTITAAEFENWEDSP